MSGQLSIEFNAEIAARRSDPATSHAAAARAAGFHASHAGRILLALQLHGQSSPHRLEGLVGLSVVQIDRRLPELKRAGLARVVTTNDGVEQVERGARIWEAVR